MRGRPKGSKKENSKKLKTFRLSDTELKAVKNTLKYLRTGVEEFNSFDYETANVYYELKPSKSDKAEIINYSNLKQIYVINFTVHKGYFISKCAVIASSMRSITIKNIEINEKFLENVKINHTDLDKSKYFTRYELALCWLLSGQKKEILTELLAVNNPAVIKQFLIVLGKTNIFKALEYAAKTLNMRHLFEPQDYT